MDVINAIGSENLISLGISLSNLVFKGSASAVANKVKALREESNIDRIRNSYDEIINELISEREEAVRIAQAYKGELDKVTISDEDIVHLHNTVERLLELLKNQESVISDSQIDTYEQIKELISVDTLKSMQLLGFNYKAAIGEPLTVILRNIILSKAPEANSSDIFQKIVTPEMVEILKNKTAYDNFRQITGITSSNDNHK